MRVQGRLGPTRVQTQTRSLLHQPPPVSCVTVHYTCLTLAFLSFSN